MESHILNSYHQAPYRTIGHKVMRAKSVSLSSESSNQNSPEYTQIAVQRGYVPRGQSEDSTSEDWSHNQTMNTTQSSQDTSSDEETDAHEDAEQNIVVQERSIESDDEELDDTFAVQEINVDDDDETVDVDDDTIGPELRVQTINGFRNIQSADSISFEDNTLVEGHDYDVITVYTVNPDLDLIEPSDDEQDQEDFAIPESERIGIDEYRNLKTNPKQNRVNYISAPAPDISSGIDLNLDSPVVSNVDEYFIRDKDILEVDGPVVRDVDEYFIKDKGKGDKRKHSITVSSIDDFFTKHKSPEEESTQFLILNSEPARNVDEFLVIENNIKKEIPNEEIDEKVVEEVVEEKSIKKEKYVENERTQNAAPKNNTGGPSNEPDLEVLPNIEDLKRYLLEDMTYSKFKSIQRSCSLPQSPMQNICMDIDDAKTCLSFEDLNLDLSDLTFDNDKEKTDIANKSDDIPRTLTEEDINSFLITDQTKIKAENNDDDLDLQDMEIEGTIELTKNDVRASVGEDPIRKLTSTPIPSSSLSTNILDFCIEKTPVKKETPLLKNAVVTPIKKELLLNIGPHIKKNPSPKTKIISSSPKVLNETKPTAVELKSTAEIDDFVDVESCNDTVISVLEANNLNSLLEQFEATEKLNKSKKPPRLMSVAPEEHKKPLNKSSLTNGMRLQDAGVQLNKNKMRQILMPSTTNTAIRRSPSPVHSDHDYCSSKKRHSLPNLKGGQSLLKPEVLSSNSRILSSRHRTCKNKKIVYNLSSDDESETIAKSKKVTSDSELKKKTSVKPAVKPPAQSNCRKKLSPTHSVSNDVVIKDKSNNSVINKSAFKASDTPCSQNSNGSIKLTIKNKSEVILNCDHKDSQKDKHNNIVEKCKSSNSFSEITNIITIVKQEKNTDQYIQKSSAKNTDKNNEKHSEKHIEKNTMKNFEKSNDKQTEKNTDRNKEKHAEKNTEKKTEKHIRELDRNKSKSVNTVETVCDIVSVKEEPRPKDENFYTALFSNKQDVKMPQVQIKTEKGAFEEELNRAMKIKKEEPKKKKLNLFEYKLRRGAGSNNSSTTVSPEAIFPDMPHPLHSDKTAKQLVPTPKNCYLNSTENGNIVPKKIFDPIREASRKILMNTNKKQKAEAMRKRDEDIVMSKIPKVENLELQPLISDAEMMKIVGMNQPEAAPTPVANEKPQLPADYVEIILVSVGTNTDESIIKTLETEMRCIENSKRKPTPPPQDPKSHINFKIKKSDHVLKQNVFDAKDKRDKRSPGNGKKHSATKIDKDRYKDITATLKSVGKQVDTKISSNSLFASIQDVVMKKAPDDEQVKPSKLKSPVVKREVFKFDRPTIVRDFDTKAEHGEDKIILHLGKHRSKPSTASIDIQTDPTSDCPQLSKAQTIAKEKSSVNRRRNDSNMSMSSVEGPVKNTNNNTKTVQADVKVATKPKTDVRADKQSPKEKRSRSRDRYESRYRRRSRSLSRSRRRRRSPSRSRSRSRSRCRYRRYRRSDSPYKRKRRSRSRSYHKRRSPSIKREHRPNRSRSRSKPATRSKSPPAKKCKQSPQKANDKKPDVSMTPPLRKPTVSESSDSSTSSSSSSSSSSTSSSSSSSSSEGSRKSRRSSTPYQRDVYRKKYRSFSSEDRDNKTPVEERRIVFVGKLEKDISKATLRGLFSKFGTVMEVRLHSKEDGSRYGFVTYQRARDAWTAVEQASTFPQYDVGFGGRRAFCRQSYADLDGLEAKYTESAFHGAGAPPARRTEDMSFEQMLQEMKKKLSQRKSDTKREGSNP